MSRTEYIHSDVRAKREAAGKTARVQVSALFAAVAVVSILGMIGVAFGWAAALAALSLVLLWGVWREARAVHKERLSVQAKLDKVSSDHESVIEVLCTALGLRDSVKMAQTQQVADLASVVAWQMGLKEDGVRLVKQAAILHDIGKIGIAENVLAKPVALDEQEWAAMRRHPEVGYEILREIASLRDVADVVYAHHERFDGQGYPRGLKGDAIPLASRIFAVVDAYTAMTADRPYRKKMPHEMAIREIVRNSLTQFDPQVVEAFLEAEKAGLIRPHAENNGQAVVTRRAEVASEV